MSSQPPKNQQTILYSAKNIEISQSDAGYMYCNWVGFQDVAMVKETGEIILDILKNRKLTHILNDNSQVNGPWMQASQWTADVWFPNMFQAGLKKFAWVLSPDIFAELSAKKAMPNTDSVKAFGDLEKAKNWLLSS